jgi:L-ribulose-5-phosphate 3-epimerase
MTRRELLAAPLALAAQPPTRFTKGICSVIFPPAMQRSEYFTEAKNAGFDAIELAVTRDFPLDIKRDDARRMGDAARKAGVQIATIWVSEPLHKNPLNHPDPAVRVKGVDAIRTAIRIASDMNCGALLLYAVRLGEGPHFNYGSQDTWDRFSAELRKVIPDAEAAKVHLNPENVWNKFLLSPLEMRAFVDQFHSPWVQTHFDTGNVMQYGYPEDWILTLGKRINRVHIKDYKLSTGAEQGHFVDLLEGDVNWQGVMRAFRTIGYNGPLSPEIGYDGGKPDQLKTVSAALDKILAMA